ncbi:hypothetical protein MTO96_005286 [Rhipicephalus appendiculatus]
MTRRLSRVGQAEPFLGAAHASKITLADGCVMRHEDPTRSGLRLARNEQGPADKRPAAPSVVRLHPSDMPFSFFGGGIHGMLRCHEASQ